MSRDAGHGDHDSSADELAELALRHLAGELDLQGSQRLAAILAGEAARREEFVRICYQAQLLQSRLRPFLASDESPSHPVERQHASRHPSTAARSTWVRGLKELANDFAQQPLALAILVLVMTFGGVLYWQLSQMPRQQLAQNQPASGGRKPPVLPAPETSQNQPGARAPRPPEVAIARLTRSVHASWGPNEPPSDGAVLKAGQKLTLASGLVEIVFDSGATAVVEGPAEIEVGNRRAEVGREHAETPTSDLRLPTSANSCSLLLGKLVARVPQQGRGFTVATPTMEIVDLGTEFGVQVRSEIGSRKSEGRVPTSDLRPPTSTQVRVYQGVVELQPQLAQAPAQPPVPAEPIRLQAGEAVTSEPGGKPPRKIDARAPEFVRELPPRQLAPLSTWPNDSPLAPGDIVAITSPTLLRLLKIDPKTGEQKLLAQGIRFSGRGQMNDHGLDWESVAIEADGHVLVGIDGLHGRDAGVLRIDPRTGKIDVLASGGLLQRGAIRGLAVAGDGAIYATQGALGHSEQDHLLKIDPQTGEVKSIARFTRGTFGFCIDEGGKGFLCPAMSGSLCHIQVGTVATWDVGDRLRVVFGVAVDSRGRIFVASNRLPDVDPRQTREIQEVSREPGHKTTTVAALPAAVPGGSWTLAVETDNSLIAGGTGTDPRIFRVQVDTGRVDVLTSGGQLVGKVGVAVVPGAAPKQE